MSHSFCSVVTYKKMFVFEIQCKELKTVYML